MNQLPFTQSYVVETTRENFEERVKDEILSRLDPVLFGEAKKQLLFSRDKETGAYSSPYMRAMWHGWCLAIIFGSV